MQDANLDALFWTCRVCSDWVVWDWGRPFYNFIFFVSYRVHPPASFPSFTVPYVAPINMLFRRPVAMILMSVGVRCEFG